MPHTNASANARASSGLGFACLSADMRAGLGGDELGVEVVIALVRELIMQELDHAHRREAHGRILVVEFREDRPQFLVATGQC